MLWADVLMHIKTPVVTIQVNLNAQKYQTDVLVTMYNVRNIRISDGCIFAQICKGLGMHLVTYTNSDMVPFLL